MILQFKLPSHWALLLVSTMLLMSGCGTTAPAGKTPSGTARWEAPITAAGRSSAPGNRSVTAQSSKARSASRVSALADEHFALPLQTGQDAAFKRALADALRSDLQRTLSGELSLQRLAAEFKRSLERYEAALMQTLERMEQDAEQARRAPQELEYERVVQNWMGVGDTKARAAAFVSWAESVMQGYGLDLQLSGERTAGVNLRAEVESFLW